ncbi:hypothetical protein NQD34_015324, partial [Periophthalmus magnuspinnatus]
GMKEHADIKQSVSKLTEEMNSLSKQVSQLSHELQEMTCLLKPLLQASSSPLLTANLTPPPSSASQQPPSACLVVPPSLTPCSAQRLDSKSLLDTTVTEEVDLLGCLLPTPHPPQNPNSVTSSP